MKKYGKAIKKIGLFVVLVTAMLSTKGQTILMQETFTGNVLPAGWYEDSAGVTPVIPKWKFSGVPNSITGVGFDGSYLRIWGGGDRSLNTSSLTSNGFNSLFLSYSEYYRGPFNPNDFMRIEVSLDGGNNWIVAFNNTNYQHSVSSSSPGGRKVVDLTPWAANAQNVKIRFHGHNSNWAIDSVVVSDSAFCTIPTDSSGVVIGNRSYACTGTPISFYLENLSRGIGQTYQWQVSNAANGHVLTDIAGATADTLVYAQNGTSTYMCKVTCLTGAAATSKALTIGDSLPTGGSLTSLHRMGLCNGTNDTLYLQYPSTDPAITYQWAYGDSVYGTYYDIPGATDTVYAVSTANFTTEKFFKCKQVCASSGKYNISDYYKEFINYNPQCYCIAYNECTCPPGLNPYWGGIINVTLQSTSFNNNSAGCNNLFGYLPVQGYNYTYFAPTGSATATVAPGGVYTLSITIDTVSLLDVAFWIDYNHSGTFDVNEYKAVAFPAQPGVPVTATFTIPFNAALGQTAMRVRSALNFPTLAANGACASYYGGETEDYIITIDTATAVTDLTAQQGLQLQVYPNPISGRRQLTVAVGSGSRQVNGVEIATMQGTVVLKESFTGGTFTTLADFAPGVYAVRVITPGGTKEKKLVVTN